MSGELQKRVRRPKGLGGDTSTTSDPGFSWRGIQTLPAETGEQEAAGPYAAMQAAPNQYPKVQAAPDRRPKPLPIPVLGFAITVMYILGLLT